VEVLNKVFTELSQIFQTAEWFSSRFVARGLMGYFAGGIARPRDYVSLAQMYDDTNHMVPALESVIVIHHGKVIFERGPALDSDIPEYPGDIESVLQSGHDRLWTSTRKLNFFFKTRNNNEVLPYYQVFHYSLSDDPLVLFIGLNEEELYNHYSPYSKGSMFLVRSDGVILSSSEKNLLGSIYPPELTARFSGPSGFIHTNDNRVIIYTQGYNGWYLINQVPWDYYRRNRSGSYVMVILAAVLGVIFAAVCLLMQRRFIFNPLSNMLVEMNQFSEGNLQPQMSYKSQDEIGQINQEVEKVFKRVNDLIHELYINKIYNQEATLKLFTSQINPHFLYNTLDSIHWKAVQNKDYEVSDQIEALSDLFRHMLSKGNDMVTLEQEVRQLENYLAIMSFRYGNRLNCTISVPESLMNVQIPKLILQPIVENAILHGIDQRTEDGKIDVSAQKDEGRLRVSVGDNGIGADAETINRMLQDKDVSHNMFALKNINQRIKLRWGDLYGIHFESTPGTGTIVTVIMPLEEIHATSHFG
jgi:two-component system sensor histidine kinase YesM